MKTCFSLEAVSPVRFTAAALSAAAVWLLVPELALAAVTFGDIGQNVADSAKGVAKGVTMAGFASGAGMGVWGCIDLYKASKSQSGQSGCQCALQRDPPCARKSDPPLGVMCKDTKWGFNEGGKRGVA